MSGSGEWMRSTPALARKDLWSRRRFVQLAGSAAAGGIAYSWPALSLVSPSATYMNPVIPGDHPDAGAIRVGNDYYLTHTTNHYTPGLLIWHSRDLVHWTVVGSALDEYYGAVWAPFLCEYQGTFYIYYPCDDRISVIRAPNPRGPWSKPISLGLNGIDPTHGATPDGRRVLYLAGGSMAELSSDGLSVNSAWVSLVPGYLAGRSPLRQSTVHRTRQSPSTFWCKICVCQASRSRSISPSASVSS